MNGADSMSPTVPPSCKTEQGESQVSLLPDGRDMSRVESADLDDAHVGLLVGLVDGKLGHSLDPVLDLVRQVRDDLQVTRPGDDQHNRGSVTLERS